MERQCDEVLTQVFLKKALEAGCAAAGLLDQNQVQRDLRRAKTQLFEYAQSVGIGSVDIVHSQS